MTRVRALKTIKYAKTDHIQPILMLDAYGQINVIVVDNLDQCLDSLKLRKNKQLAVSDIINANIVFSLSRQLNLDPGIYREADSIIWDYIKKNISTNILTEDIELLMQELQESWQRLRQHSLARRYLPLAEYQPVDYYLRQPAFAGFGVYDIFIKDYLYELSRVCFEQYARLPDAYCVLVDLIWRSLHSLNYSRNIFHQQENVIACLKWHKEAQADPPLLSHCAHLQAELDKMKGAWFAVLKGAVLLDLEEFEIDYPNEAGVALARVIEDGTCVSEVEGIQQQLLPLVQYLSTNSEPLKTLMKSSKFDQTLYSIEQGILIVQDALRYGIAHFAKLRGLMLKPFMEVPFYFWAGKGLEHEQAKLVSYLEDKNNLQLLKDFELKALSKYSEHKVVQAFVEAEIVRRQSLPLTHLFSLMSLGPYMPGTVLNMPRPAPLLFRPSAAAFQIRPVIASVVQSGPIFDETVPDEENILSLKEPSGCTVM